MVKMVKTLTPIDDLTGGLEAGTLVLIYGPTGCGKTTLCLKMAENVVGMGEYQAIYIDTEGGAPEIPGIRFMRVKDFRELGEALKRLRKEAPDKTLIFVDSMTAHYHRRVLSAPAQFRASIAAELGGTIAKHLNMLREIVEGTENIAILTAHLKSPVEYNFKMNMLRKMAKAWKDGRYEPSPGDYMNVFTEDPVKWIGGRALGMHVHRRLRIFVDEDETRILYIEKWPLKYNYCIRYVIDRELNLQRLGGLFDLQAQMKRKLLSLEFKTLLAEALEVTEKEGIEVEEAPEGAEAPTPAKPPEAGKKPRGPVKLPKVPSLDEIASRKSRGSAEGEADEPGDSGPS
jgi:hypothetical protein